MPPGWYPHPSEDDHERWWDGNAWKGSARPRLDASRHGDEDPAVPEATPTPAQSAGDAPVVIRARPGTLGTTALMAIGVVLFAAGWLLIGAAGDVATNGGLIDSDIPPLVTKALSGLLVALLGAVLFGAALVRRHVAAWALWLRDFNQAARRASPGRTGGGATFRR